MLEMMGALATGAVALNAVADELAAATSACHGQPVAEVMFTFPAASASGRLRCRANWLPPATSTSSAPAGADAAFRARVAFIPKNGHAETNGNPVHWWERL
jgi:hypothetical protein